eukprot:Lankesteria_metandrocarpae@DN7432_c0_g1_i1.p2
MVCVEKGKAGVEFSMTFSMLVCVFVFLLSVVVCSPTAMFVCFVVRNFVAHKTEKQANNMLFSGSQMTSTTTYCTVLLHTALYYYILHCTTTYCTVLLHTALY